MVLLPADVRGFSPLKPPDRSKAHPAFYSLGNDGRHGREADDRPLSSVYSPIHLRSTRKELLPGNVVMVPRLADLYISTKENVMNRHAVFMRPQA